MAGFGNVIAAFMQINSITQPYSKCRKSVLALNQDVVTDPRAPVAHVDPQEQANRAGITTLVVLIVAVFLRGIPSFVFLNSGLADPSV